MKTPKGLKKHQSKVKSLPLNLEKIMHFEDFSTFRDRFKTWDEMEKSPLYKGEELVSRLCAKFAENVTGYSHFSNLFDEGGEFTLKMFANKTSTQFYDSNNDDSSSNDDFDKYDNYEEIKENFKDKVLSSFQASSLKELKEFEDFYNLAVKKNAFTGTMEEFIVALKKSDKFLSFLGTQITRYTG